MLDVKAIGEDISLYKTSKRTNEQTNKQTDKHTDTHTDIQHTATHNNRHTNITHTKNTQTYTNTNIILFYKSRTDGEWDVEDHHRWPDEHLDGFAHSRLHYLIVPVIVAMVGALLLVFLSSFSLLLTPCSLLLTPHSRPGQSLSFTLLHFPLLTHFPPFSLTTTLIHSTPLSTTLHHSPPLLAHQVRPTRSVKYM